MAAKLGVIALLIVAANAATSWLVERLELQIWPEHMEIVDRVVLAGVILYTLVMATPFLPGVELGLILMTMLGPRGVALTYACTLLALSISFGLGRLFPGQALVSFLQWLHLARAAALLDRFHARAPEERLAFIAEIAPSRAVPILVKHRYLIIALLLNLPGNTVIGGAGGIAMVAGMSRLYSFPMFFVLIALAVLPGPVLVLLAQHLR